MEIIETGLKDCYEVVPNVFGDNRGYFMETFNEQRYRDAGMDYHFVQGNQSYTKEKGTLRGLHFQTEPFTQAKLVSCLQGELYDVVVDLREGSPTYKKWVKVYLSGDNKHQLMVPRGFAHAFITISNDVIFTYMVDNLYSKEHDAGVLWSDPEFNIDWGIESPILSQKDKVQPVLSLSKANFKYRG